jgi:hypothetical protein
MRTWWIKKLRDETLPLACVCSFCQPTPLYSNTLVLAKKFSSSLLTEEIDLRHAIVLTRVMLEERSNQGHLSLALLLIINGSLDKKANFLLDSMYRWRVALFTRA